jgi:flagellar biosynthetic protein FlhB
LYLQLFSQERTEEATPRRLQKARDDGQAPRSTDLMAGLSLVVATMALQNLGPTFYNVMAQGMVEAFSGLQQNLTPEATQEIFRTWALRYLRTVVLMAAIIAVVGVIAGLLQTRFLVSSKPLAPDFSRINPLSGFKRIFSLRTVVEQAKGLVKLAVVAFVAYKAMSDLFFQIPNLIGQNVAVGTAAVASRAIGGLQSIGYALLAIGVFDYAYQYWEFKKSIRMTKDEVKREHKDQDGSPELKQQQRKRAREMARRRRAIKEVPGADVVITNPTHYAIAVRYDAQKDGTPVVIAKGSDLLAQRIKVVARKHDVPLVENRPLARTLYATVEVGKAIPPELYQAVAEVLAVVYSIRRQERQQNA